MICKLSSGRLVWGGPRLGSFWVCGRWWSAFSMYLDLGFGASLGGFFGAACSCVGCLPAVSLLVWRPSLLPCF